MNQVDHAKLFGIVLKLDWSILPDDDATFLRRLQRPGPVSNVLDDPKSKVHFARLKELAEIDPGLWYSMSHDDIMAVKFSMAAIEKMATDWVTLKDQLRRSRDTGFREKTIYALSLMESLESE